MLVKHTLLIAVKLVALLYVPIKCFNCVYEFILFFSFRLFSVIVSIDILILKFGEWETIKHSS